MLSAQPEVVGSPWSPGQGLLTAADAGAAGPSAHASAATMTATAAADERIPLSSRTGATQPAAGSATVRLRRLPVIDEQRLVGIISQADIATHLDEDKVGDLVEAISAAP